MLRADVVGRREVGPSYNEDSALLLAVCDHVARGRIPASRRLFTRLLAKGRTEQLHLACDHEEQLLLDLVWMFHGLNVRSLGSLEERDAVDDSPTTPRRAHESLLRLVGVRKGVRKHTALADTNGSGGDESLARFLSSRHIVSTWGRSLAHWAAEWNDEHSFVALAQWLLQRNEEAMLWGEDGNGDTPLMIAARHQHHAALAMLIKKCPPQVLAHLNHNEHSLASVYLMAHGKSNLLYRLVRLTKRRALVSLLHTATRMYRRDIVASTLARGVPVDALWKGRTALSRIVPNLPGSLEMMELLLRSGADPNKPAYGTESPHLLFCFPAQYCALLYEHGAQPNLRDSNGLTPLMRACMVDDVELVRAHLRGGADACAVVPETGKSVVHFSSNHRVLRLLVRHGADINARDRAGNTPMHNQPCIEILGLGGVGSLLNGEQRNALHVLDPPTPSPYVIPPTLQNRERTIRSLVESGVLINEADAAGCTPLHMASFPTTFEALLANGADVNLLNAHNQSALHMAAASMPSYSAFYRALLVVTAYHPQQIAPDCFGDTIFHAMARRLRWCDGISQVPRMFGHNTDGIEVLQSLGVDVDSVNRMGEGAIHICARVGSVLLLQRLLDVNADQDLRDSHGRTPLHLCCSAIRSLQPDRDVIRDPGGAHSSSSTIIMLHKCVRLLLDARADPGLLDCDSRTPLHHLLEDLPVSEFPLAEDEITLRTVALEVGSRQDFGRSGGASSRGLAELAIRSVHAPLFRRILDGGAAWEPNRWVQCIGTLHKWSRRPFLLAIEDYCKEIRKFGWSPARHYAHAIPVRARIMCLICIAHVQSRDASCVSDEQFCLALWPTELLWELCESLAAVDEDRMAPTLEASSMNCLYF